MTENETTPGDELTDRQLLAIPFIAAAPAPNPVTPSSGAGANPQANGAPLLRDPIAMPRRKSGLRA